MSNVLPFPKRETVPLYRISSVRAKAMGACPAPANDMRKPGIARGSLRTQDQGDEEIASLLERSIRAIGETR